MSLEHAILGFLQYGPNTGYDLKNVFDLSVQHFWPADQSQIYRTLTRLAEQGWVDMDRVEQEERPDRKLYRLTDAGKAELHRWLLTPLGMKGGRNAALVQVFFAGQLSNEELLAIFRRAADACRMGLAHLREVPAECRTYVDAVNQPREQYCWMLTLECGITMTEAHLTWLENVIARLERGEVPPCTP